MALKRKQAQNIRRYPAESSASKRLAVHFPVIRKVTTTVFFLQMRRKPILYRNLGSLRIAIIALPVKSINRCFPIFHKNKKNLTFSWQIHIDRFML